MTVSLRRHKRRPRAIVALAAIAAIVAALVLPGCATLGYYGHLTAGELAVLRARVPITQVIADPHADPALRTRLRDALAARAFASDVLKLPRNKSYTTYADIHRPFVMWNVFATPALSVSPIEHCFPFAGCVAYQGFYARPRAEALAERLAEQGDDVWIGGVPAYSTLGHFADPLLSTMDRWSEDELIGTIFHELAHQELYVKGDTAFNESFATFVQQQGLRAWHAARDLPPPDPAARQRQRQFTAMILATRERLQKLYAGQLDDAAKLQRKQQIFADLHARYLRLRDGPWHGDASHDEFFKQPLNNAALVPFGLYDRGVPAFAALFRRCGHDWTAFYAAVRKLGVQPAATRAAFLAGEPVPAVSAAH